MTDESDFEGESPAQSASDTASWAELVADADAIAAEYRGEGWTVDVVEPRDVAPWAEPADEKGAAGGPQGGFVALIDDATFDTLEPVVEDRQFGAAEVYTRSTAAATFILLVELDAPTERAVVLPMYYRSGEADDALASAAAAGELQVRIRADGGDDWLTFVHEDPTLFVADD